MRPLFFLLVLLSGSAFAYDYAEINRSKSTLVGAISGALESELLYDTSHYLPGYGLNIYTNDALSFTMDPLGSREVMTRLSETLTALSGSVRGLDESDWISVTHATGTMMGMGDMLRGFEVVVRMRPGEAESLEVYLDGVRQ